MMAMPVFNAAAICPKCGHGDIHAVHTAAGARWGQDDAPRREHIFRRCNRCSFHWYEAPLDSPLPTVQETGQDE